MATTEAIEHIRGLLASGFSCNHFEFDGARLKDVLFSYDDGGDDGHASTDPEHYGGGRERSGFIIFTTTDGKVGVASDSEDYTGHG